MSRTRRFLDGVALTYANQVFVMLVGLWLTPFLLHRLGQHDFGLWLIGLKALSYLALLDIGVLALLPREVAFAKGRLTIGESPASVRQLIEETTFVVFTQLPLLAAASLIAWQMMPRDNPVFRNAVGVLLAVFAIQFPLKVAYSVLEGLQELGYLGILQLAGWAAGLLVNVTLVFLGKGLYGLAFGWAATQALISVGSIWKLYRSYPDFAPLGLRTLPWSKYKKLIGSGMWVSLGQLAQMLRTSDFLLIGKILGPQAVVPYSCSGKLVAIAQNQPLAIMQSAQPALSELRVSAERKHLARVVSSLTQAMLLLSGLVSIVALSVNRAFVVRWVGSAQYLGFALTLLLLLDMLFRHWNVATVYSLFAFGRQRHISTVAVVDGAVTAVASGALIMVLGPLGAPLGSLLTVVIVSLPWNLRALTKELDCSFFDLIKPIVPWALRFAPLLLLLGLLGTALLPTTYVLIAIGSTLVALLYLASQWGVFRNSPLYDYVRRQLTSLERPAKEPDLVAK
jgi:O-antigen/teichoic acid export membrane protein